MDVPIVRVGALGFDHGHITSLMQWAQASDGVDLVAACHRSRARLDAICDPLGVPSDQRTTDFDEFWDLGVDLILVSSSIDEHPLWAERVAAKGGAHMVYEKPLAMSAAEGGRMIEAADSTGHAMAVNWPLANEASHSTAARLIREGAIGALRELAWYGGNSGPFAWLDPHDPNPEDAWMYDASRGGGCFEDYLGYGVTIATWMLAGALPRRVSATAYRPPGLDVDTQAAITAEYSWGLARFDTRWSTLSNPWIDQPFPRAGFIAVGEEGAIASYDYADHVEVYGRRAADRRDVPALPLPRTVATAMDRMVAWIRDARPIEGPSAPAVSLLGQQIVDAARSSAARSSITVGVSASGGRPE